MFDSGKGADGFGDAIGLRAGEPCGRNGGENILEIMRAGKRDFRLFENDFFLAVMAKNNFFAEKECALRDALFAAKPENFRLRWRVRRAGGIVSVEDGEIVGSLFFENAGLSRGISFHRAVAIEVIGGEIQEDADVRTERFDQFELEAAEFRDGNGLIGGLLDDVDERSSDIPGEQCGETGVFQNVFDERSGCGFSVGASNGNEAAMEKAVGKFDLAPDANVVGACGL